MDTLLAAPCRECSIYALCDPYTGEVRYVGKSDDPARRFRDHLTQGQLNRHKTRKNSWIKGLLAQGTEPILDILDVVPADQANHAEREYIGLWRYLVGDRLLNGTDGGDGGAMPPEVAKAAGLKRRGRVQPLSEKEHRNASMKAYWASDRSAAHRQARVERGHQSTKYLPVRRGEQINLAKLDEDAVREMRRLHTGGMTGVALALKFGVTPANVSYIVRRVTWKHVT